jgi:putative ABC transport system permease protein
MYLRLLKESFAFAMSALRNNKLRTMLSLLGVTIGIFSIIAVLAAVDSLDNKIKAQFSTLDKNTMYLKSRPFGPSEIPRWKRDQFPDVNYDEFQYLKANLNDVEDVCYQYFMFTRENVKYEDKTVSSISVVPVTYEFASIQRMEINKGRFFNEAESNSAAAVIVLGYNIAQGLFGDFDALGKTIRIYGQNVTVIGVTKKKGASLGMADSDDDSVFIPVNFLRRLYGDNTSNFLPVIVIKPEKDIDVDALKGEITQKLRSLRGVKDGEINNFFLDVLSGFTELIDKFIGSLKMGGWIISGFSLLVGGFGIANIMFVSVKERTNLIGIQKSLGAKNRFILFQFLFEAVILCVLGGIIGLLLVWIIAMALTKILDFEFILSFSNMVLGTSISAVIGLIAGILPAISASQLDPVEAIRTGM